VRQYIALTALVVADYDEAIGFYAGTLGFTLVEDRALAAGKRWVVVRPPGAQEGGLLLAKASEERQWHAIGDQSGGRVFLFLQTDDFDRDHAAFIERGVRFLEEPRHEAYGTVAVFEDLYGNRWDLIGPRAIKGLP
jgi:catechol 2,3-dioxygenase-like lactoylglutathione lyase family enzyme